MGVCLGIQCTYIYVLDIHCTRVHALVFSVRTWVSASTWSLTVCTDREVPGQEYCSFCIVRRAWLSWLNIVGAQFLAHLGLSLVQYSTFIYYLTCNSTRPVNSHCFITVALLEPQLKIALLFTFTHTFLCPVHLCCPVFSETPGPSLFSAVWSLHSAVPWYVFKSFVQAAFASVCTWARVGTIYIGGLFMYIGSAMWPALKVILV